MHGTNSRRGQCKKGGFTEFPGRKMEDDPRGLWGDGILAYLQNCCFHLPSGWLTLKQPNHLPDFKLPNSSAGSETRVIRLNRSSTIHDTGWKSLRAGAPPPQPFLSGLSGLRDMGLIFPGTHLRPSVCLPAPSFCQRQETGGEMLKPEEMRSHIGMWPKACWLWGTSLLLAGSPKFWSFLFPSPRSALSSTLLDHARVTLDGWRLKKHSIILAKFTPIPNLCSCVQSSESQRKSIKEPQTRAHSISCCSNLSLGKDRKSKGANSRPSKQSWGHGSWGSQARETTASPQGWPVWCYCQLCFHLGLQRPRNIPPSPFIG